jgi:hypothetical protein
MNVTGYSVAAAPVDCYLIIPHPTDARALFIQDGDGCHLPFIHTDVADVGIVSHLNRAAARTTGIRTATLGCLRAAYDAHLRTEKRFYVLDSLTNALQLPQNAAWLNAQEIAEHPHISNEQKVIIRTWFLWHGMEGKAALRVPWAKRGWFREIEAWMLDLADRLDMRVNGNVEQIRVGSRSSTLRVSTTSSALYFKACHVAFSYEPVVTRVLSIRYPGQIPEVVAVNVEQAWMLTREFKGTLLTDSPHIDVWEKAIRAFAEIQMDLVENTHLLIGLGLPDRHLDYLITQIDRLMADLPAGLHDDEKDYLARHARPLKELCYDLLDYKVPLSIVHGDFWAGNVAIQSHNQQPVFFDWSDSSISHPFFDMPHFLATIGTALAHVPDARQRLLRAYLEGWTRYESLSNLAKIYQHAEVVSQLYRLISYHHFIIPALENMTRWETEGIVPKLTRQLIATLKTYHPA